MHDSADATDARAQDKPSTQQVIFCLRGTAFSLPVRVVRSVLRMPELHPLPQAPSYIKGLMTIRGRTLAVVDLAQRLSLPAAVPTPHSRIMIVRVCGLWVGLLVDHVEAVDVFPAERIQTVPTVLPVPVDHCAVSGIVQADSHLVFLLDPGVVLSPLDMNGWRLAHESLPP